MSIALNIVQILLIALSIFFVRHHFGVLRAAAMMERFSSPGFLEIRDEAETFLFSIRKLGLSDQIAECREVCKRDTKEHVIVYNRLHALGMFFGEIGVYFQRGVIDRKSLRIFDRLLPYYWHELSPFIIACHIEYKHPIDLDRKPEDQNLVAFGKFGYAYKEMLRRGFAKRSNDTKLSSNPV